MTDAILASNDSLDPLARACLRRARALRAELGQDPAQLAAVGLALMLMQAADELDAVPVRTQLRRA